MLRRAQDAGARVVVLTVDLNSGSNRVLQGQISRTDGRDCNACHGESADAWIATKPMYSGTGSTTADWDMSGMTWDYLTQMREVTSMKIVVKGIVTAEDAKSCVQHGADAVYVSNHGGRAEARGYGSSRRTYHCRHRSSAHWTSKPGKILIAETAYAMTRLICL